MTYPRVVVAEPLHPEPLAWLAQRASVVETTSPAELRRALPHADALVVRTYTAVTAEILDLAPRLLAVARAGVGLDNIDQTACRERGIRVLNAPNANTNAVVEYVLSAILSALRPIAPLPAAPPPEDWERLRADATATRELAECAVGILGLGRIGSALARAIAPLAAEVLYTDLLDIPEPARHGARPVPLDELLERSHVLSIHVDGRHDNHRLLAAPHFARLKPTAVLINAARGAVLSAPDLADFLRAHPSARAVLDVHDPEPLPADHPLLALPNAALTPHTAAATARAKLAMSWVVRDLWDALQQPR